MCLTQALLKQSLQSGPESFGALSKKQSEVDRYLEMPLKAASPFSYAAQV